MVVIGIVAFCQESVPLPVVLHVVTDEPPINLMDTLREESELFILYWNLKQSTRCSPVGRVRADVSMATVSVVLTWITTPESIKGSRVLTSINCASFQI